MKKTLPIALVLTAVLGMLAIPVAAWAEVSYLPDVTAEMSDPTCWSSRQAYPSRVLADQAMVAQINDEVLNADGTGMYDLDNWSEGEFDGVAYAQELARGAQEDASYFFSLWARIWIDEDGNETNCTTLKQLEDLVVANCIDEDATTSMPIRFGIVTTQSCVRGFPRSGMLVDSLTDKDYDYQCQTSLRVNEPLVIQGESNDGAWYHIYSSCTMGWVPAQDVAVCADKQEWLDAWSFGSEQTLVVCEDKIITEDSHDAPQTANRVLPLGTCLRLATHEEAQSVSATMNRTGHNCHVVWLPVRNEDGTFGESLGLISEHCKVSEGYLPLTATNISKVALSTLGNTYGWGGALHANDCSGLVRDIYKCFGLELARNTTWQEVEPVTSYSVTGMDPQEKADLIRTLPLGSVFFMKDHEMIYLGSEGDQLYVVSTISRIMLENESGVPINTRLRGCVINTLDTLRANGDTWLQSLDTLQVPYYPQGYVPPTIAYACTWGDGSRWSEGDKDGLTFAFGRSQEAQTTIDHLWGIRVDGRDVDPSCYALEQAQDGVRIVLSPEYLDTLSFGSHAITMTFDDGDDASAGFEVRARATYAIVVEGTSGGMVRTDRSSGEEGQEVRVSVTRDPGYALKSLDVLDAWGGTVRTNDLGGGTYAFNMPASDVTVSARFVSTAVPKVYASAHVERKGWLSERPSGKVVGTTGKSLRLEALRLSVVNAGVSGGIKYKSHIQNIGWERSWKRNGRMSGTQGKSYRIEAVRIKLYGKLAKRYDVYYRVHAQGYGWMKWTKNGKSAGTQGMSRRLEAIQVVLVPKGSRAPAKNYKGVSQTYKKAFVRRR